MNADEKIVDLLNVAHSTLTNQVVPSLSKQDRYNCLMVANAIRIAARHFQSTRERHATASPDALLDKSALVRGIRAGQFDDGSAMRKVLVSNLRNRLIQQLRVDNPRVLENLQNSPQAR
ncbi:DUF6285 domain-containing protein [Paraburkholderia sp. GAS32]|jgi:hypothetical protein|uniref:DUF6285 domain-containing protein n=1 Tax=Paraburkholderia sp. GAS32 TaxID=3035129 RepID=UPI003D20C816